MTPKSDTHPAYATTIAYRRDLVVFLTVFGGTEASVKEKTLKLTDDQFGRLP